MHVLQEILRFFIHMETIKLLYHTHHIVANKDGFAFCTVSVFLRFRFSKKKFALFRPHFYKSISALLMEI